MRRNGGAVLGLLGGKVSNAKWIFFLSPFQLDQSLSFPRKVTIITTTVQLWVLIHLK